MMLEEAENEIASIYRWFAEEAPGVVVQEEGHLAQLWAFVDARVNPVTGEER